jgi:photosystem II stability/assembly factor-like uncharacterized protein
LFAVCAFVATVVAAQWHYLSGGRLSGISSVGSFVWAVGQDGLMFVSQDNGQHWRRVPRFTTRNLVDVEFWDQSFGLITAEGDIIYRTTDNGGTWDSSYVQYIAGHIRFITRDCIWVTSNNGSRILRSMDGGLSWPLSGPSWNSSWFIDSLNGWSSYETYVFRTSDAGQRGQQSWQQIGEVPVPPGDDGICCFGFCDSLRGVCAWHSSLVTPRYSHYVYGWSVTADGGGSWNSLTESATPGVVCDVGADGRVSGAEEHGCIIYEPSVYHRTGMSSFQQFRDVSAACGDRAWLCGDGGAIWTSSDSGVSWAPAKAQSGLLLQNVSFSDSLHGWGASLDWAARTSDGGRSWIPAATSFGISPITDVVALDESTCVTAAGWWDYNIDNGYEGAFGLERTTNAGASWDTIHLVDFVLGGGDGPIGSSRFAHVGQRIWHAGTRMPNGNSLRTTDGGATWLDMDTLGAPGEAEPADISFLDTLNGWAIDSRTNIRRTTNGGDSWTIIAPALNVKRLEMTSLSDGWAISDSELFKTTDGGATWQSVMVQNGLQAIGFCNPRHGAIVGLGGLLLRTSDGGQTWLRDSSEFTSDLHSVCVLDSGHMWATGDNGLVLGFGDWALGIGEQAGRPSPRERMVAVSVRPNPCRGRATLWFSEPLAQPARVTLVDVAGRVVMGVPARAGTRTLDLDLRQTPSGVYFVRMGAGSAARLTVQR